MTTAKPLKLPVIIETNGTQARAGLRSLGGQLNAMDRMLGGHLRDQASMVTGSIAGLFSIQAALDGLKALIAYGQKVQTYAQTWDPKTIEAKAQTDVAQMQYEQRVAATVSPISQQVEIQKQAQLARRDFTFEAYAASMNLQVERIKTTALDQFGNYAEFFANPSFHSALRIVDRGLQFVQEQFESTGSLLTEIATLGYLGGSTLGNTPASAFYKGEISNQTLARMEAIQPIERDQAGGLVFPAGALRELQEINRNTRGKP
jgi:hypothetical protein